MMMSDMPHIPVPDDELLAYTPLVDGPHPFELARYAEDALCECKARFEFWVCSPRTSWDARGYVMWCVMCRSTWFVEVPRAGAS